MNLLTSLQGKITEGDGSLRFQRVGWKLWIWLWLSELLNSHNYKISAIKSNLNSMVSKYKTQTHINRFEKLKMERFGISSLSSSFFLVGKTFYRRKFFLKLFLLSQLSFIFTNSLVWSFMFQIHQFSVYLFILLINVVIVVIFC